MKRHCKNCNNELWGRGECHIRLRTNFYSCSNKSVFALSSNGLCFGKQIDWFNVFIYTFTVHPSCQRIFDFYEHAVVKKSSSFI